MYLAVEGLCTGGGDVRERLRTTADYLVPLRKEDFPERLQDDFEWVMNQLTRYPARCKKWGPIDGTLARIRRSTGAKIAQRIFQMFLEVQKMRNHPIF